MGNNWDVATIRRKPPFTFAHIGVMNGTRVTCHVEGSSSQPLLRLHLLALTACTSSSPPGHSPPLRPNLPLVPRLMYHDSVVAINKHVEAEGTTSYARMRHQRLFSHSCGPCDNEFFLWIEGAAGNVLLTASAFEAVASGPPKSGADVMMLHQKLGYFAPWRDFPISSTPPPPPVTRIRPFPGRLRRFGAHR